LKIYDANVFPSYCNSQRTSDCLTESEDLFSPIAVRHRNVVVVRSMPQFERWCLTWLFSFILVVVLLSRCLSLQWPSLAGSAQNTAAQKYVWGFLNSTEVRIVEGSISSTTHVRLVAHDLGGPVDMTTSSQLPHVPPRTMAVALQSKTDSQTYVWLEYRPGYERTWGTSAGVSNEEQLDGRKKGVVVRVASGPASSYVYKPMLIDATPETNTFVDAPLKIGLTLNVPEHGLYIRVVCFSIGVQMPFLDVVVKKTPFAANEYPHSLSGCVNGTSDVAGDGTGNGNSGESDQETQRGECVGGGHDCKDGNGGSGGLSPSSSNGIVNSGSGDSGGDGGGGSGAGLAVGLTFLFLCLCIVPCLVGYYVVVYKQSMLLPAVAVKYLPDAAVPYCERAPRPPSTSSTTRSPMQYSNASLPLPKGWTRHFDDERNPFYYHDKTAATQWEFPEEDSSSTVQQTASTPALPDRTRESMEKLQQHSEEHFDYRYENQHMGRERHHGRHSSEKEISM
jgi:uncharacterized membrane protein YgcG